SSIGSRLSEDISSAGVLQSNSLSRDSRSFIILLQSSGLIRDIQKLALLRLDGLGLGKLHMQIRQERPESGGLFLEALRSDTDEHSPAVTFQKLEYLIGCFLRVFAAGFVLDQKVRYRRMQVFDRLVYPLHLRLYGELAVIPVEGVDDLTASVKGSRMRGHPLGAIVDHDRIRG